MKYLGTILYFLIFGVLLACNNQIKPEMCACKNNHLMPCSDVAAGDCVPTHCQVLLMEFRSRLVDEDKLDLASFYLHDHLHYLDSVALLEHQWEMQGCNTQTSTSAEDVAQQTTHDELVKLCRATAKQRSQVDWTFIDRKVWDLSKSDPNFLFNDNKKLVDAVAVEKLCKAIGE